jgi:hypothetical protein
MSVRTELSEQLIASSPHLTLEVDGSGWNLYVLGVSRIGGDSFVQLALVGPRFCTVTARVPAALDPDRKAREIFGLVLQWIGSNDRATQAFLESPDCVSVAV